MSCKSILKKIKQHEATLRQEHHVSSLYLFGSFARGEATAKSDVDVLVEFATKDIGLFEIARLKEFLESVLKRHVDIATRDALKDWMKAEIERDAIRAA